MINDERLDKMISERKGEGNRNIVINERWWIVENDKWEKGRMRRKRRFRNERRERWRGIFGLEKKEKKKLINGGIGERERLMHGRNGKKGDYRMRERGERKRVINERKRKLIS